MAVLTVGVGKRWTCLLAVAAGLMVGVSPAAATGNRSDRDQLVGCSRASERVTINVSSRLDSRCTYTGGFDITASNLTLDCRGALLEDASGNGGNAIGISVDATANLANITIRNCRIDGWFHAIDLVRNGATRLAAGHEYDNHLDDVRIEDTLISGSRAVGIYVHPYVTGTTLLRTTVTESGSTAVYLDEGSRGALIEDNVLTHNGFAENGPGGTTTTFSGLTVRYWGPGREGIAVDGSSDNIIRHNRIVGNSAGGVFLYTNCGENVHNDPASWLDHRYGAEHNLIADNVIVGKGAGVWVASRMGENVYAMDCSDPPYVSGPLTAITLDRAPNNSVRGNLIAGADFGVRVEDDHATVMGNRFVSSNAADYAVIVGTPYRTTALGKPVSDTVVAHNVSSIAGNPSPYRWVDGVSQLRDDRNVTLGKTSTLCKAPDIPRGPFVMVYAFALQDPAKPPVPAPPYTAPSLGVLPACT